MCLSPSHPDLLPSYPPFKPYEYITCTCGKCPLHPSKTWVSTTTTFNTPYVPKHRKPGPAQ